MANLTVFVTCLLLEKYHIIPRGHRQCKHQFRAWTTQVMDEKTWCCHGTLSIPPYSSTNWVWRTLDGMVSSCWGKSRSHWLIKLPPNLIFAWMTCAAKFSMTLPVWVMSSREVLEIDIFWGWGEGKFVNGWREWCHYQGRDGYWIIAGENTGRKYKNRMVQKVKHLRLMYCVHV